MRTMIHVTSADIKSGKKCSEGYCPIALATKRALKYQYLGTVRVTGAGINVDGQSCSDANDTQVNSFIRQFDSGASVYPINIPVDLPAHACIHQ